MGRTLAVAALLLAASCAKDLSGDWTGWGTVVIKGHAGTYTDTYGTGPGTFSFEKKGDAYEGKWGESAKRHGTMSFTVSDDARTLTGAWKADDDCAIKPGNSGTIDWRRVK